MIYHYFVQEFLRDYKEFRYCIADYDMRLGSIFGLAFDDCPGCESAFKVGVSKPYVVL